MPRTLADWLEYIERQHPVSIDMGLERVRAVAGRLDLGRPARQVVTVAGTNGKGSTVAFIEAIARAAGWRVGAYTSPHLRAYNERVRIDGREASDAELVGAFEAVEAARRETTLTYFEYGTLAALWLFARAQLDLAVLEVGLGGRLDATNLVDPDVAVITTVDLDHQAFLGDNREAIGREKAGIARPGRPLVLGEDDPPASVLRHAYAIGAPAIRANCDFFFEPLPPGERSDARDWRWREPGYAVALPRPALHAPAQRRNAATAIAALRSLGRRLPKSAIAQGVAAAYVPGRLQRIERDGVELVLDVGHNPQAARELAASLAARPAAGRTFAVYAALRDKDAAAVVSALAGRIDGWHLAGLDAGGRGQDATQLVARLQGTAADRGRLHSDVATAVEAAIAQSRPGDRILVFGSFHTVAEATVALARDSGHG
jgi:dihydrofolate synthase / folylpolyglutamate synthase